MTPWAGWLGRRWRAIAVVVAGTGILLVVVLDGSWWGRLVRGLLVAAATAAAWSAQWGGGRALRASATFVAGLAAVVVGVGVGGPHLVKGGSAGLTLAGLLSLLAGVPLLLAGGAGLIARSSRWLRPFTAVGLLAVAYAALWSWGQALAATNVPPSELGVARPADFGIVYRDVDVPTSDGETLAGWYVPPARGEAAVVLLHGAGSTRSHVLDQLVALAEHGLGVLAIDARGHGESTGRAMDFGWYGDLDIDGAVSFLAAQPGVDPERIGAVGLSMGGEEAIGAAGSNPLVHAVVAEGATGRMAADRAWLSDEHGWRGQLQEGVEWILTRTTDLVTDASPPMALRDAVVASSPRPILLIAAAERPDELAAGRWLQAARPDGVTLWVAAGGHTEGLDLQPEKWTSTVVEFLSAALLAPHGEAERAPASATT